MTVRPGNGAGDPGDPLVQRAPQVRSAQDLAQLLRALRRRHARERQESELTYRELAARTGWSHTAIAEYMTGRTLPPTDRLDGLLTVLGATALQQGALATARDRVEELRRHSGVRANGGGASGDRASGDRASGDRADGDRADGGGARAAAWAVPRQLPAGPAHFVGRVAELKALAGLADRPPEPGTVVISAVAGMAGVGKTALAVHAAHRLAGRFPDGQLFIDLHGYTEGMAPVEPADALDRLLRDVGVPGERIPSGLDERAALWRSVAAGRRLLIVLDNAATEAQVRPLLPGAAGSLVLVTSRRRLTALDACDVLSLETLPEADAVELFVHTAGRAEKADSVSAVSAVSAAAPAMEPEPESQPEPDRSAAEVVALCGWLPLAIRIAAARLRHRRVWTVADLLEHLRDMDARLAALDDGQRSVHATLHLTYENLPAQAQRLYRLLGSHPGPDAEPYAAAALTGGDLESVRRALDGLVDDHLLAEPVPGRYTFHDLVRAHAAGLAAREEEGERQAALDRLLDHYGNAATAAMELAYPYERRRNASPPAESPTTGPSGPAGLAGPAGICGPAGLAGPAGICGPACIAGPVGAAGGRMPLFADRDQAGRWLDTELANLLAAAHHAGRHGRPGHVWQLATALNRHLRTRGRSGEAETLHRHALELARRLGNGPAEMEALNRLGHVDRIVGRYVQACGHHERALRLAQDIGDRGGQLDAEIGLGDMQGFVSRHEESAGHYGRALRLAREVGDRFGERQALSGLGDVDRMLCRYEHAAGHYALALEIAEEIGDHVGQSQALAGLGHLDWYLGRYERAADHLERALRAARIIGDRVGERHALAGLGNVYRLAGRLELSAEHYGLALEIARDVGHRIGELQALTGLSNVRRMLGSYGKAAGGFQQVLELALGLGNNNWRFEALQGLGRLYQATGRPDVAVGYHEQALRCAQELSQAGDQARAHDGLAHAHDACHRRHRARRHWRLALDILTELDTDHTEDIEASVPLIRAHLDDLDRQSLRCLV